MQQWFLLSELESSFFCNGKPTWTSSKVFQNKDFCNVVIPSEDDKILQFNQHQISNKAPFIIDSVLECLTEKIYGCKINPKNSSTTKVCEQFHKVFQCLQNYHPKA